MNPELDNFSCDWLFHFGLEFPRDAHLFSGVKFICTGGSEKRILAFAKMAQAQYGGECKFFLVQCVIQITRRKIRSLFRKTSLFGQPRYIKIRSKLKKTSLFA